jgi:putative flippase GtrA
MVEVWRRIPQGIRFLIVGGWNTVFGLGLFAMLHFAFASRCHYLILLLVTNEMAIINAYILHKFAVFTESPAVTVVEVVRFHSVYLVSIILGMVLTYGLVEAVRMHPIAAQGITTVITVVVSYLVHKRYSFGTKDA